MFAMWVSLLGDVISFQLVTLPELCREPEGCHKGNSVWQTRNWLNSTEEPQLKGYILYEIVYYEIYKMGRQCQFD